MTRFKFEKFANPDSSFDAKVTIRRTGQFGFNAGAVNKYAMEKYPFVVLYYDAEHKVIGIELLDGSGESALELNSKPSNCFIRAKNFCDRYGIEYGKPTRFPLRRDDETGFLYFELKQGETSDENAPEE